MHKKTAPAGLSRRRPRLNHQHYEYGTTALHFHERVDNPHRTINMEIQVTTLTGKPYLLQACSACGPANVLHRHPDEICVSCQLSDYYWNLNHWQAEIWNQLREDEHEEAQAYMIKDRAYLYKLQEEYRSLAGRRHTLR